MANLAAALPAASLVALITVNKNQLLYRVSGTPDGIRTFHGNCINEQEKTIFLYYRGVQKQNDIQNVCILQKMG